MDASRRAWLLGLGAAARLCAQSPVLEAVAARYGAMATYTLGITRWRESAGVSGGPAAGRREMRLVYEDATHFRYESPESLLVADGDARWHYRDEGREYLREAAGRTDSPILAAFNKLQLQFVGRFRQLPRLSAMTNFQGQQRVPGTKLRLPQFEIAPGGGEWLERIWVDPAEALVVQSAFSRQFSIQGRQWSFHRFSFAPQVDRAAFRFTPPARARQVERFSSPPVLIEAIPL